MLLYALTFVARCSLATLLDKFLRNKFCVTFRLHHAMFQLYTVYVTKHHTLDVSRSPHPMIRNHGSCGNVFPGLIKASRIFVWRLLLCEVGGIARLGLGLSVNSEIAPVHRELRVELRPIHT